MYATHKLAWHSEVVDRLRTGRHAAAPITVHFMPELRCNQRCAWCAYGHRAEGDADPPRRNEALMSDRHLPLDVARLLISDLEGMGCRSIELTGGGEPLIWPHVDWFLERMADSPMQLALVTNGTALTPARAEAFGRTRWKWARVSIDAGDAAQYTAIRRVPAAHHQRAWEAVERLVELRDFGDDSERRVGVGFVVANASADGVYAACERAYDVDADNIRLSIPLGVEGQLDPERLAIAREQAAVAEQQFTGLGLTVVNLLAERAHHAPRQFYKRCITQEVLCVVGGDGCVYSCCTLAFTPQGRLGSLHDTRMRDLWPGLAERFYRHDSCKDCQTPCLYEQRNLRALAMVEGGADLRDGAAPLHVDYV